MKNRFFGLFFLAVVFFCFFGCKGKRDMGDVFVTGSVAPMNAKVMTSRKASAKSRANVVDFAYTEEAASDDSVEEGAVGSSEFERKLIKNGRINIEVKSLEDTQKSVEEWCKSFGGYILDSSSSENSVNYTVKVPADKFEDTMNVIGSLGKVSFKNINVSDVSDEYYDLNTRLQNRKVLRDKLSSYLKKASDMSDLLKIEKELNNVQSEIESMEGRMKRLNNQIDYSTIYISATLPFNTTSKGFIFPDVGESVRRFITSIIGFFGAYIAVVFYIMICGIPILALLSLLFWLLFGRVGLLLKLYDLLKKR